MSIYTDHSPRVALVGGIKYRLIDAVSWHVGMIGGPVVIVPPGFEFDVSVPPWLQWLYSPHERKFFKAAALHDYLLAKGWDRMTSGAIFHDALRADGVPVWRALSMWLAVSLWRYR